MEHHCEELLSKRTLKVVRSGAIIRLGSVSLAWFMIE